MEKITKPFFSVQWHITALCDQRCKHCYLFNSPDAEKEIIGSKTIDFAVLTAIADNIKFSCERLDVIPRIFMTGGDPILSPYFWDLSEYLKSIGIRFGIMGNPFHITDEVASRLHSLGVLDYQLSLDGLETMHDSFRKRGSFRATLTAADILKRNGIEVGIMSTISKINATDIPSLTRLAVDRGVASCTFARYCPNSSDDFDLMFQPLEYRAFLEGMWEVYDALHDKGTRFPLKDHLWYLLLMEKRLFSPESTNGVVVAGCGMGVSHLTVLADGSVYACRRFPSPIGKVPGQSFDELFLGETMKRYRVPENYSRCCQCELFTYCRGCSAVSHCMTGSWKSADPQCWK